MSATTHASVRQGGQEPGKEEVIGQLTEYGWRSLIMGPPRACMSLPSRGRRRDGPFLGILCPPHKGTRPSMKPSQEVDPNHLMVTMSLTKIVASRTSDACGPRDQGQRRRARVITSSVELDLMPQRKEAQPGAWRLTVAYVGQEGGFRRFSTDVTPASLLLGMAPPPPACPG